MKKLRQVVIKPLTNLDDLEIDLSETFRYDLQNLEADKFSQILEIVRKMPGATLATSVGEQSFVNTHVKGTKNKNRTFSFPEPNPICIYYNSANSHLQHSYILKNEMYAEKQHNDFNTHYERFVEYFQETSEGVILLSTTIEGFINQLIPDNVEVEIKGKSMIKSEIEWLDINTKLRDLIPKLKGIDFYETNQSEYQCISHIIDLRNDLVHLKRVVKENNTSYQTLFKRLVDFEHVKCSDSVLTFINKVIPGYLIEV